MHSHSQLSRRTATIVGLVILCGAPFLASLDLFVVNVAFDRISAAFPGHALAEMSWILNGYAIIYAALLIPLARWADRIGHKRMFLIGVLVFTAASAAAAASPGLWELVGFRLVQAVGAAALTPTSLALLLNSTPPDQRALRVRIWTAVGAAAAALGPAVGGLLVEANWRWVFLINVPIGIAIIVAGLLVLVDHRAPDAPSEPDLFGALTLTFAIGALTTGIVQGHEWGWTSTGVLAAFAIAAAASIAFLVNNSRKSQPLVDPGLFRVASFGWSNATALAFSAAFAAGLLIMVLWLQTVWGYSALRTGLALTPGPILVPVVAIAGQALATRLRAGTIACIGSTLWAIGTVLILLSVDIQPAYATAVLPGWILGGIGVGLTLPTILSSATTGLPPAGAATGSAVVTMTRQIGTVLGVSVLIALLGTPVGAEEAVDSFQRAWWVIVAIALVSALVALGMSPRTSAATDARPTEPARVA